MPVLSDVTFVAALISHTFSLASLMILFISWPKNPMLNKPKMHTFFSRLKKERMVKRRERRKTQNRKKKEKLFYLFLFLFLHNEELVLDGWICWSIRFFSLYIYPFFYIYLFFPRENILTTLFRFITFEKNSASFPQPPPK